MDFIKDKQKLIELTNELINSHGRAKVIAEKLDSLIFGYLDFFLCEGDCGGEHIANEISTVKAVRDLFLSLETN
jgi:hypothetical protein